MVVAYQVGTNKQRSVKTIHQQHKQYILENRLDINLEPCDLFQKDSPRASSKWRSQGNRIIIFADMNKYILNGSLAQQLLAMGFAEATHTRWHKEAPHTFINGSKPIDGVYHTQDQEIMAITQLSFHKSVGDHCTVLVNVTTR
jgi:hypothetical protein